MSKRKRKRRLRPRTIWWLVLGYFVLGAVVAALFLQQMTAGAPRVGAGEPSIPWGQATALGRQVLPGESGMDGFFYARLRKRA